MNLNDIDFNKPISYYAKMFKLSESTIRYRFRKLEIYNKFESTKMKSSSFRTKIFREKYELSPSKCLNCNNNLLYEQRKNKYCSTKCAAIHTQQDSGHRKWTTEEKQKQKELVLKNPYFNGIKNKEEAHGFKEGYDKNRRPFNSSDRIKAVNSVKLKCKINREKLPFESFSKYVRKDILISERGHKCENCNNSEWLNKKITLEVEHINGNNQDNNKTNLKLLCPNCHSLTPTWRRRKKSTSISDETIKDTLKTSSSIKETLLKCGLSPNGANYKRIHELKFTGRV